MSKIDKFSNVTIIDNLHELDTLLKTENNDKNIAAIELFDVQANNTKNYNLLGEIAKGIETYIKCGLKEINLIVPYERLPKKEFAEICKFAEVVNQKLKVNICVNHRRIDQKFNYDKTEQVNWDIDTIIKANTEIDKVCDFIKERNLSPLEALAFIHEYVGSVAEYNVSNAPNHSWKEKDQLFAGAYMKLPEVICAGYSSLEREIIHSLNMPGLKCEVVSIEYDDEDEMEHFSHARCYIEVNDTKYKINQSCFDDPTWDRKTKDTIGTYNCFALSNKFYKEELNNRYRYRCPYFTKLNRNNFQFEIVDYDPSKDEYNKGENNIDQSLIEKVYFSMLQKIDHNKSFREIYRIIEGKTECSAMYQKKYKYNGYFKSDTPELTKQEARSIYDKNVTTFSKNTETTNDMNL